MTSRILISRDVLVFVVAVLALGMGQGPNPRLGLAFPTHFGNFGQNDVRFFVDPTGSIFKHLLVFSTSQNRIIGACSKPV